MSHRCGRTNFIPNCVEIGVDDQGNRLVRDSKNPDGPVLTFTAAEWEALESSIRAGQRF